MKLLVLQASNVDFQIEPKKRNQGIFSLFFDENNYIFEWIPDPRRDKNIILKRNIPPKVTISLNQITRIDRVDDSFQRVGLSFILDDNSRLPLFIFNHYPHIFVTHLLEFLTFKAIINASKNHPSIYYVINKNNNNATIESNIPNYEFSLNEKTDLKPEEVVSIHTHNQILNSLGFKPNQILKKFEITISDLNCSDFSQIKELIFINGIAADSRPLIWPILLGVIPFTQDKEIIKKHLNKITDEYLNIQTQFEQLTNDQIENSTMIKDFIRIINNDVLRNDRQDEQFKDDDSPNLILLRNVLIAYAIFNRDTSYVQGMNDLVSPFIVIFIQKWEGNYAYFYDGTKKTQQEAEAFIFWCFVGMMELTQHERLFTDLANHQAFILKRVAAIATSVHSPLKSLLSSDELQNLSFLFKPMLLLFKRAFKQSDLLRLWDSIFTAESPPCYSRFVGASVLLLLFPKLLIHTNQTLGEVMNFADGFLGEVDIDSILYLASLLMRKIGRDHPMHDFIYELIPDKNDYRRFYPKYFKLSC